MPRFRLLAVALLCGLAGLCLAARTSAAPAVSTYDRHVAEARAHAAARAPALALDAYRAALPLAPDADTRRWCQLWILELELQVAPDATHVFTARLDALLDPYRAEGRAPDPFWIAARELKATLADYAREPGRALAVRVETARFWSGQSPSPATTAGFVRALADLTKFVLNAADDDRISAAVPDAFMLLQATIDAAPAVLLPADLASVALGYARGLERHRHALRIPPRRIHTAYDTAVARCAGTGREADALVFRGLFRLACNPVLIGHAAYEAADRPVAPPTLDESHYRTFSREVDEVRQHAARLSADQSARYQVEHFTRLRDEFAVPELRLTVESAVQFGSRVEFRLEARHVRAAELALHRVPLASYADFLAAHVSDQPSPLSPATLLHRWTADTGIQSDLGRATTRHEWQGPLPAGAYVIVARDPSGGERTTRLARFLVTGVQAITAATDTELDLHVFDAVDRQPAKVVDAFARQSVELRKSTPAGPGQAQVSLTGIPRRWEAPTVVFGEADGHPFVVPRVNRPLDTLRTLEFHLNTDRALYQPGESARWKITARAIENGRLAIPRDRRFTVTARLNHQVDLATWEVTLNRFGTVSGSLPLPSTAPSGPVSFALRPADSAKAPPLATVEAFTVDRFRGPESLLSLEPVVAAGTPPAAPGGEVEFDATARYVGGEPIAGARLTAQVTVGPVPGYYPDDDDPNLTSSRNAEREAALAPVRLEATTDRQGRARLRVPLHPGLPTRTRLTVAAQLVGDGHSATATQVFQLLPGGVSATLSVHTPGSIPAPPSPHSLWRINSNPEPPRAFSPADVPIAVLLTTRDGREAPVAAAGDLALQRLEWEEFWRAPDGTVVGATRLAALRRLQSSWPPRAEPGWEKLYAGYRVEGIATVPVRTAADGRLVHTTPPLPAGYYRLLFRNDATVPTSRNLPDARLDLFVADAATTAIPVENRTPLLVPCAASPVPDQPLRTLVIVPPGVERAAVYLSAAGSTQSRIETFSGNARIVEFPWRPEFWSGVRLDVVQLDPVASRQSLDLVPDRTANHAVVSLDVPAAPLRPGATARMKIRTATADGRPLSAEVGVAVSDAALAALIASPQRTLAETFLDGSPLISSTFSSGPAPRYLGPPRRADFVATEPPISSVASQPPSAVFVGVQAPVSLAMFSMAGATYAPAGTVPIGLPLAEPTTRARFTYTAAWHPEVLTDDRGEAELEVTLPDNLTAWEVRADAVTADHRFGNARATVRTSLPLQARLRTPRSLVVGDRVELLGALVNTTDEATAARIELASAVPATLALVDPAPRPATIPAQGETTLAWTARALAPGPAPLRLEARGANHADAMEWPVPVRPDAFEQRTGAAGRTARAPLTLKLDLPRPLDPTRTRVDVQISAGVVPALLDALPYLIDYPYGCTEQTVSRFVPAVLAARLLRDLGFSAAEVAARLHPAAAPPTPGRPAAAGLGALDEVIAKSLEHLVAAQLPDGSFPWFPHGQSDPYMTAYVVRALDLAHAAGLPFPPELRTEARAALFADFGRNAQPPASPLHRSWHLHAALGDPASLTAGNRAAAERLFRTLHAARSELVPAAHALLLGAAHALELGAEAAELRALLDKSVVRTTSREFGAIAHWGRHSGYFDGLESAVESTALALSALLATAPQDPLVDAAASWLLLNRSSDRWNNTRDTATAFFALHAYARARGELAPTGAFRLAVNGRPVLTRTVDRHALLAPATVTLDPSVLVAGSNRLTLEPAAGSSPLFMVAASRAWADAGTARASGDFLRVSRRFVRLAEAPVLLGPPRLQPESLDAPGAGVTRNELVECRLVLETSHPIGYLAIESPRPAGCEPAHVLSGWDARLAELDRPAPSGSAPVVARSSGRAVYREEHDDRSVFFLPHLPAGRWELVYRLRATFAGDFRALPATVAAMYVPALAANGTAARLVVRTRGD